MSKSWEFVFRLRGYGKNEDEALDNALEAFHESPGEPVSSELVSDDVHPIQRILSEKFECRSYSGRGMYGRRCLAVVADSLGEVVSYLARGVEDKNREEVADGLESIESDRLGKSEIFYFSSVEYVEEDKLLAEPEDSP